MAIQNKDLPRFSIVTDKPYIKKALLVSAVLWLLLGIAFVWLFIQSTESNAYKLRTSLAASQDTEQQALKELKTMKQELANSKRSEFISRAANNEIQIALAEKDEQIAGLKADLDFYERLVGSSGRRHGLIVHNAEFTKASDGAWQYAVTLTQNINRGGITSGQMRFDVDGVSEGKLKTISWNTLLQNPNAPGQAFSFRYFQQMEGSVMLPADFNPQNVRVTLKGSFGTIDKVFNWQPKQLNTTTINN
jgi:hypothetical protein